MKPGDIIVQQYKFGENHEMIQTIEIAAAPPGDRGIIGKIVDVKIKKIRKKSSKTIQNVENVL